MVFVVVLGCVGVFEQFAKFSYHHVAEMSTHVGQEFPRFTAHAESTNPLHRARPLQDQIDKGSPETQRPSEAKKGRARWGSAGCG